VYVAYQYAVGQQVGFFECSAKEMLNVAELFSGAVRLIDRVRKSEQQQQQQLQQQQGEGADTEEDGSTAATSPRSPRRQNVSDRSRARLVKMCTVL
jgi:hypothetical protein